ncbi:MAG: hypothetical protein EOP06_15195 [Proteobacteria bacterium]|nr:MAG: hypothetical protein EOP06_15195 [Pseudomonadota bacterium]
MGHLLPEDYRKFLRDYAGFRFECVSFSYSIDESLHEGDIDNFDDSTDEETLAGNYHRILKIFIPATRGPNHDIYPGIHLVRDVPRPVTELGWAEELLRIGYDVVGNDICPALFGLRPGAVFYWIQGDDIFLVADSFDEFMQRLHLA